MAKKKMKKEECCESECCSGSMWKHHTKCKGGIFYCLGFIGAATYYISIATGFWIGVLGVLKALVWPAFLVYSSLKFLGM